MLGPLKLSKPSSPTRAEQKMLHANSRHKSHVVTGYCGPTSAPFTHADMLSEQAHLQLEHLPGKQWNLTEVQSFHPSMRTTVVFYHSLTDCRVPNLYLLTLKLIIMAPTWCFKLALVRRLIDDCLCVHYWLWRTNTYKRKSDLKLHLSNSCCSSGGLRSNWRRSVLI